jgi:hypothetical protein
MQMICCSKNHHYPLRERPPLEEDASEAIKLYPPMEL